MMSEKKEKEVIPISASDLFAISQGSVNNGSYRCHWCGSKCDDTWRHDDPPPIPFQKNKNKARYPAEHWICLGCWLWRRSRVTVTFLDGSYKDSQPATHHSWWITDDSAKAINSSTKHFLHSSLLKPPNRFILSLVDEGVQNQIHLSVTNDVAIIEANTPLFFTYNNILCEYTVYDLDTALRDKEASRTPGVRILLSYFSSWEVPQLDKRRPIGKPKEVQISEHTKKVITLSGVDNK